MQKCTITIHPCLKYIFLWNTGWIEYKYIYQQTLEKDEIDNLKKKCGEKVVVFYD